MKVAVPSIMSQAGKDYLTSRGFELIETKSQSAAALVKEAADADGIILMTEPFPNTLADQLPKLKVIARPAMALAMTILILNSGLNEAFG